MDESKNLGLSDPDYEKEQIKIGRRSRRVRKRLGVREGIDENDLKELAEFFYRASREYGGGNKSWNLGKRKMKRGGYRTYLYWTCFLTVAVIIVSILYFLFALGIIFQGDTTDVSQDESCYTETSKCNISRSDTEVGWDDRINFLPIYLTLLFALYFVAKQYSYYRNLHIDMAHRGRLVDGYTAIFNSTEKIGIKDKMGQSIVDYIASPPHTKEEKTDKNPLEVITNIINQDRNK